jgi:hypothetical protein
MGREKKDGFAKKEKVFFINNRKKFTHICYNSKADGYLAS